MSNLLSKRLVLNLALLLLPAAAGAQSQYFTDSQAGDVDAGFRKTGSFQEKYEMVEYLGNITNFMALAPGATITISNATFQDLTNMCPDGYGNLQWSVFASFDGNLINYWGNYSNLSAVAWPHETCWYTVPRTNVNIQSTPINRIPASSEGTGLQDPILGVSAGGYNLSEALASSQGNTNVYNNSLVILEPTSSSSNPNLNYNLTAYIGQSGNTAFGDFGGQAIDFSVENITSNSFTSPAVSDFYVTVPVPTSKLSSDIDPLTGTTNGTADYLGYFTLQTNATLTFTRAATVSPPAAGTLAGSATNGFAGLQVVFTNTASGSITNWVWNFGNGVIITNSTGANVTNTYSAAGTYTVTLTVYGPGGSSMVTVANYIVTSPTPKFAPLVSISGGKVVIGGSNCPVGLQYRVLTTTNVALAVSNWIPVLTNTFQANGAFSFTNSTTNPPTLYFRLVSP